MNNLYENGKPYSQVLANNIIEIKERLKNNFSSIIVIDGGLGKGKTTLAVEVADDISGEEISLDTKFHPQISMGGEEFLKNLQICYDHRLNCIIYDEAGDFNKRGALTRFNSTITRTFETFRAFKIIVILCLPSFETLDNNLLSSESVRGLIHIVERNNRSGNFAAYNLYRMFYIREQMRRCIVKNDAYRKTRPNFRGHFLNLSDDRKKQLDTLSTSSKLKELGKSSAKLEGTDGLISYKDVEEKLGLAHITVWGKIKKAGIKPAKVVAGKNYYNADIFDKLVE